MIHLRRQRTVPPVHTNFRDPKRIDLARRLLADQRRIKRGEIDKHPFDSKIWKKAKTQLLVESSDKCAYCEAPTAAVAYGDVEHYRPKSIYWWLAYSMENYLVSCALCNQKFKKDKFPIDGPKWKAPRVTKNTTDARLAELATTIMPDPLALPEVRRYESDHAAEAPLLINPYIDNPENIFAWRPDNILEEVEVIPNATTPGSARLVDKAEKIYGMNRLELKKLRYITFASYRIHRNASVRQDVPVDIRNENATMVIRMMDGNRPFAGMIRHFESIGGPPPPTVF